MAGAGSSALPAPNERDPMTATAKGPRRLPAVDMLDALTWRHGGCHRTSTDDRYHVHWEALAARFRRALEPGCGPQMPANPASQRVD